MFVEADVHRVDCRDCGRVRTDQAFEEFLTALGAQRAQQVEAISLDAATEAVALGATVAAVQPQDNVRVLLDPAGHPCCLCRDEN